MAKRNINDEVKKEFIDWLMTPPSERAPATKTEMAEHLGVSLKTLYNWEKTDEVRASLRRLKIEWGARWHGDILQRLMEIVTEGPPAQSVSAAKILLQHLDTGTPEAEDKALNDDERHKLKVALEEEGWAVIE